MPTYHGLGIYSEPHRGQPVFAVGLVPEERLKTVSHQLRVFFALERACRELAMCVRMREGGSVCVCLCAGRCAGGVCAGVVCAGVKRDQGTQLTGNERH